MIGSRYDSRMRSLAERQRLHDELLIEGASGGMPRQWLNDEDVGIRGCAALASSLSGDPQATRVLVELARSPRAFDVALGHGTQAPALRHFTGPPRWTLIEQVCSRAGSPDDLWVAATVAAPRAFRVSPCPEIGPYLRVVFAGGWPQPDTASSVQRAVARRLAERTDLWQRNDSTRAATLGPLGLPDDRAAWQELASSRPAGELTAADILVVEERIHAIRMRPQMYLNLTGRDDPRLPGRSSRRSSTPSPMISWPTGNWSSNPTSSSRSP